MKEKQAITAVVLSGVLWGIINVFTKQLAGKGLSPLQITAIRLFVATPVFTLFLCIVSPEKLKIRLRDMWMFVGTGVISVVLFNCFYFYTTVNSQASVSVVLLYTSPVFVMLFSALLFHEKITGRKLAALIFTITGCVLVAGFLGGHETIRPLELVTGLASGLFYALYTIFARIAMQRYDMLTVTAYTFLFGMIASLPLAQGRLADILWASPSLFFWCLGIGVLCTVLPYALYTWGLANMESSKAAILVAVEPLVGAVIGIVCFHEGAGAAKLCGMALILSAIVLLNRKEHT